MANDKVKVEITGDNKDLKKSFAESEKVVKTSSTSMAAALGSAGKVMGAGFAAVVAGGVAVNKIMGEAVDLANIQEKEEKKLEAVLKATGNAAGFSANELKKLASQYQSVTTVGDETILSGMSILATFKNIRKEGFERATMAALDMSAVMGQDLNSSMVQIGKAVNDPIKGLSSLSRVGVTFTEQQKEQIKVFQESGELYKAQDIILKELESEFGGVASAMVELQSGALTQLGNTWGDVLEVIGQTETQNEDLTQSYRDLDKALQEQAGSIAALFGGYGDIKSFFVDLLTSVVNMADDVQLINIALVDGFNSGWISVKYGGQQTALALTSIFGVAGDQILEKFADILDSVAEALDSASFTIKNPFGDDWTVGFDSASTTLSGHAKDLRDVSTAEEDYREAVLALSEAKEKEIEIHKSTINAMVDEALGLGKTTDAKEDLTEQTIKLNTERAIEQDRINAVALAAEKSAKKQADEAKKLAKEQAKAAKDAANEAEKAAKAQSDAYRHMFSDLDEFAEEHFELQDELLDKEAKAYKDLGIEEEIINRWRESQQEKLVDNYLRENGRFIDGVKLGYREMLDDQKSWAQEGLTIFNDFSSEAQNALSSNLFDVLHGDFDNLGDAWRGMWDSMLKKMTDIISEMIAKWVASEVIDFAAAYFHDGAWEVGSMWTGDGVNLKPDEVPAVLQEGEMVFDRGTAALIREAYQDKGDLVRQTYQVINQPATAPNEGYNPLVPSEEHRYYNEDSTPESETNEGYDQHSPVNEVTYTEEGIQRYSENPISVAASRAGIGLTGFAGKLGDEFGKDFKIGAISMASGASGGTVAKGILSPANLFQNVFNAARHEAEEEYGVSSAASLAGDFASAVSGLLGLGAVGAQVAGAAVSVGVEGLMDAYDIRELESIRDEMEDQFGWISAHDEIGDLFQQINQVAEDVSSSFGNLDSPEQGAIDTFDADMGNIGDDPGDMVARYGGVFSGPDSGYPVELHGTEAVVPLKDGVIPVEINAADKEGAETLEQLRKLATILETGLFQLAKNTGESSRLLKRWDGNGIPEERVL